MISPAGSVDGRARMAFSGKSVIVTGAASGLGFAIASRFADLGAAVLIADIDQAGVEQACDDLQKRSGDCTIVAIGCDVSNADDVDRMTRRAVDEFGRLDVVVSNAGIGGLVPFMEVSLEHWNRVLAVNLTGVLLCGQAAARAMIPQGGGRIVNIASVSGVRAGVGRTAYGTTKAGVVHLTKQMAVELGQYGISVNAVAPGPVDTPMALRCHTPETRDTYNSTIPLHRYGTTEEIASAVTYLSTDEAAYVNGQTLCVDGGFVAAGIMARDVLGDVQT